MIGAIPARITHTPAVRIAVETHGCRLNRAETDAIAQQLRAQGHELVAGAAEAEIYLLNSCAITHQADADARAAIRRAHRQNPEIEVVVTGCHATAEPERLAAMPGVRAVVGNLEKNRLDVGALLRGLEAARSEGAQAGPALITVERLSRKTRPPLWTLDPATELTRRTRPMLKIQDGCDYQCSFCIVPSVRGRSRSSSLSQATEELRRLHDAGHPEVVLTGAHLGLWGRDLGERPRLAELISSLGAGVSGARLRLGSVDPHEVDDALVRVLAAGVDLGTGAGLCQYLHMPMQSGDDGVLRDMRRAHTVADLEALVPELRAAAPDIGLGVDVIVGFPGESDAAFERTRALLARLELPFAHVFSWSPRSGTPATERRDRIAPEVVALRSRLLRTESSAAEDRFYASQRGALRSAVVLRRRARRSGALVALTDNYLKVELSGSDALLGRRVQLRVGARDDAGRCSAVAER